MDRDPMIGPPPTEVPLPKAPLVCVLAQVRFPILLKIEDRTSVAGFQEAIRARYPYLAHEKGQHLSVGPGPALQVEVQTLGVWRFADAPKGWTWRASLGPDFLSLETTAYRSRDDFLDCLTELVEAAERELQPGPVTRIGMRYIDRLTGPALESIGTLLDSSVLGVRPTPLGEHAQLSLGEALLTAPEEEATMRLRFGLLPAGATTDPTAIPPISEKSWVLDLDMFDEASRPFAAAVIEGRTRAFAERIYSVFRALVTSNFLRHYGGNL